MKVLFIASECAPIIKVGGLADVVGALPKALKKLGVEVSVAIPFYQSIKLGRNPKLFKKGVIVRFGAKEEVFDLWQTFLPAGDKASDNKDAVPLFLIKNDKIFGKNVYFQKDATSEGSDKEAASFLFLSLAGIEVAKTIKADILHCHDWHTATAPFWCRGNKPGPKTVLTIHNLEHQGVFGSEVVDRLLGINWPEDWNCLKQGILNADIITTVSPSYAKEILTDEFGAGLQGFLREGKESLIGILNGLDTDEFDPQKDATLKSIYSVGNLDGKAVNKKFLQDRFFGKSDKQIPILGMVSRLAIQKGIDLLMEIFEDLMAQNLQLIVLGTGMDKYEDFFGKMTRKFPQKFCANLLFDEKLARQIYAGADIFLIPSFFEPCGLGQQIAMRYGTVPVARAVGGLKDTIKNFDDSAKEIKTLLRKNFVSGGPAAEISGTGFLFEKYDAREFSRAIKKALDVFQNEKAWRRIQLNGMKQNFSWEKSARTYKALYNKLTK
ncbi:MAG: glycogen synthase [Candidatus Portnoybacteria bacterium]|nr:glycogen synthase [Candidatus Portnoybacteria bacterium]